MTSMLYRRSPRPLGSLKSIPTPKVQRLKKSDPCLWQKATSKETTAASRTLTSAEIRHEVNLPTREECARRKALKENSTGTNNAKGCQVPWHARLLEKMTVSLCGISRPKPAAWPTHVTLVRQAPKNASRVAKLPGSSSSSSSL